MLFQGENLTVNVEATDEGPDMARLCLANRAAGVNKFDRQTLTELGEALTALESAPEPGGLIIESALESFVVGADIAEFVALFRESEAAIADFVYDLNALLNRLEDLPCPTVAVIDGAAMGGGLEAALACDFRVLSDKASVGLPEVKLGICPGFGGTVRLPRLIGVDNALEWVCTGKTASAEEAFRAGVADAVVASANLDQAAQSLLVQTRAGDWSIEDRRAEKTGPVRLNDVERLMAFTTGKAMVASEAGPHFPAPPAAARSMEKNSPLSRNDALRVEAETFARLAKTPAADSLVGLFLNEQALSRRHRASAEQARAVSRAGVLGAGIMGGGIAYQAARRGVPVLMKDINETALDQGMAEAASLLGKRVSRGRLTAEAMAEALARIRPTLEYTGFETLDIVVEAVVENPEIKQQVLCESESRLPDHAVLATNTSTIAIDRLAEALAHPERFCGMHFFNPVHRMPLVEVIQGAQTTPATVATVVQYAQRLGKTPIVVRDCPGFYVNRVLFPYLAAFNALVRDGVPFTVIDRVMEGFGWPMGPAYLLDVVGLDTAHHAAEVMAEGYPDRMALDTASPVATLFAVGRHGQKNGQGFYRYDNGQKTEDPAVTALLGTVIQSDERALDAAVIIDRMMLPLCIEAARCLEEGIIASPGDGDLGLAMGLGFPLFRGGPFRYMDQQGLDTLVQTAGSLAALGPLYEPTPRQRAMAGAGETYYGPTEASV